MSDSSKFNSVKYALPVLDTGDDDGSNRVSNLAGIGGLTFVDTAAVTDGIANNAEAVLSFQHTPSGKDVFFKAFIETFTETYSSNYNEETVFGRTDPIVTFKNTTKRISLSWKIPAETISEAFENLQKVQSLAQFLYPNYESIPNALTLSQTPLVRLKVMNLLSKVGAGSSDPRQDAATGRNIQFGQLEGYRSTNSSDQGMLGVITSMSVDHNLGNLDIGVVQTAANTVLPKMIFVSIDFMAIHEETLGWGRTQNGTKFNASLFPYNINQIDELSENDHAKYGMGSTQKYQLVEDLRRKRKAKEQACANSQANMEKNAQLARNRYSGMFGGARYNRDRKRVAKLLSKQSALSAGEELSKRKQAKLNALSDITSGRHTDIEATLRANGCFDDMAPPDGGGAIDNMGDNIVDFGDITEL